MTRKIKDRTGERYGMLTAVEIRDIASDGYKWRCVCDCGNYITVRSVNLRNKHTRSCGCMRGKKIGDMHDTTTR